MKLGFIGFGEVGSEMTCGLKSAGVEGIVAYDAMQEDSTRGCQIKRRSEHAGVTLLPNSSRGLGHSSEQRKLFAFPPESAFTFRPEYCSDPQRNGVRLQTEIHLRPDFPIRTRHVPLQLNHRSEPVQLVDDQHHETRLQEANRS